MRRLALIIIVLLLTFSAAYQASSDVVYFDGRSIDGRIVKETPSFIVVETFIGKVTIDKEKITSIKRAKAEKDFLKLGDYCFARGRYDEAIEYYEKSLEANPDFDKAKEALKTVQEAKRYHELITRMKLETLKQERERDKEELKSKIGLVIEEIKGQFKIVYIAEDSPVALAQVRPGDYLWSIEGRSTKNLTFKELHKKLIEIPISFVVERRLNLIRKEFKYKNKTYVGLGLFLDEDKRGLIVVGVVKGAPSDEAGIRYKDRVIKINDILTKDISLDKVRELISNVRLTRVNLVIRRDIKVE